MQSEGDTKRSEVSKISNWTRQGDIWREQVNEQLFATNKQMKEIERKTSKQDVPPQVTSYDLDQLQDKMRIITQQTVSASISAWSDKTEGSIREIERQVALVRIGGTDNSERPLSPEDVQTALQTTLPSEMLLKGAVASEVLLLESKVSDKIESKLLSLFQNEVSSTKSNIDRSIEEKVKAICSENGFSVPSSSSPGYNTGTEGQQRDGRERETTSNDVSTQHINFKSKISLMKKEADAELAKLEQGLTDVHDKMNLMTKKFDLEQKTVAGAYTVEGV
jgi:hypothetical protein